MSGLVNISRTMGGSLGLAVLSTLAAGRTAGRHTPEALTAGYALAFRTGAVVLVLALVLMLVWLPRRAKQPGPANVPGQDGPGADLMPPTLARAEERP